MPSTLHLTLQRRKSLGGATLGKLYADGSFLCYTLEDEVRERPGVPVADWKIKGATAIPSGSYKVTLEDSMRFGPETLSIGNVPGFLYIRMHAGNTAADTEGCPLLGMQGTETTLMGGTSRPAVALVKSVVKAAIAQRKLVTITITNATELA